LNVPSTDKAEARMLESPDAVVAFTQQISQFGRGMLVNIDNLVQQLLASWKTIRFACPCTKNQNRSFFNHG